MEHGRYPLTELITKAKPSKFSLQRILETIRIHMWLILLTQQQDWSSNFRFLDID